MGQSHSHVAGKSPAAQEAGPSRDSTRRQTRVRFSEPDPQSSVVKPKDLVTREPSTALCRMLPIAHQTVRHLPIRIRNHCLKFYFHPHDDGPDAGLAFSISDLSETMMDVYKHLSHPQRESETELPFSGPDLAESVGILALKLERWTRDFEKACPHQEASMESVAEKAVGLRKHCDQTTELLASVHLRKTPKRARSNIFHSRGGHGNTPSSQSGMGRSIFGV